MNLSKWASNVGSMAADVVYPCLCHLCSTRLHRGATVCDACADDFTPVEMPFCSQCSECFDGEIGREFVCPNCDGMRYHFEFARAAYQSVGGARQLIHDLKYGKQNHLVRDIAQLCDPAWEDRRFRDYQGENSVLVPIPLHWKRKRSRGFNQASEIAKCLSKHIGLPCIEMLQRTIHTESQTHFSRRQRLKNLKGAFQVNPRLAHLVSGKNIVLFDDVLTTGSTAEACAKTLLEAGAKRVCALTFLRG